VLPAIDDNHAVLARWQVREEAIAEIGAVQTDAVSRLHATGDLPGERGVDLGNRLLSSLRLARNDGHAPRRLADWDLG
jgi:hypothetical protein